MNKFSEFHNTAQRTIKKHGHLTHIVTRLRTRHRWEMHTKFWSENLGRRTSTWKNNIHTSFKETVWIWAGLIWLKTANNDGLLRTWKNLGFHKKRAISWLADSFKITTTDFIRKKNWFNLLLGFIWQYIGLNKLNFQIYIQLQKNIKMFNINMK
jgi:hypothetical protein